MSVRSSSWRLSLTGRLARLLPPCISGALLKPFAPHRATTEPVEITARSSLAAFRCRFARADRVALAFAVRGFSDLGVAVVANSVCRPGDTVVEVGANVGATSLLFACVVGPAGRVICFETLPENARALWGQLRLNNVQQVTVHFAAVSDRPEAPPHVAAIEGGGPGQGRTEGPASALEAEPPSVTLDGLRAAGELPAPRLIAIDAHGAELPVLRGSEGLIRGVRPHIVLRVALDRMSQHGISPNDLFKFFDRFSYGVYEVAKWGLREVAPGLVRDANWLCLPQGITPAGLAEAKRISGRIRRAQLFPLIPGLNPAVATRR